MWIQKGSDNGKKIYDPWEFRGKKQCYNIEELSVCFKNIARDVDGYHLECR